MQDLLVLSKGVVLIISVPMNFVNDPTTKKGLTCFPSHFILLRNGVVRYESVMLLRNKLEELGKMKGVNQDEKG